MTGNLPGVCTAGRMHRRRRYDVTTVGAEVYSLSESADAVAEPVLSAQVDMKPTPACQDHRRYGQLAVLALKLCQCVGTAALRVDVHHDNARRRTGSNANICVRPSLPPRY